MKRAAHLAFPDAEGEPLCRLVLERDGGPGGVRLLGGPTS